MQQAPVTSASYNNSTSVYTHTFCWCVYIHLSQQAYSIASCLEVLMAQKCQVIVNTFPTTLPAMSFPCSCGSGSLLPHVLCKHQRKALGLHGDVEQGINWLEEISSSALLSLHPSTLNPSCLSRDLNSGRWHGSWKGLVELVMYSGWGFASRQGNNTFVRHNRLHGAG